MSEILSAFLKNESAIRRYLMRIGANGGDVEDLMQEIFLKGFAAEMKFDISEPKAYLFKIAKNVALERAYKLQRMSSPMTGDFIDPDLLIDEDQASADEWLDGRRKLAVFSKAVAHLPPRCRRAFLMRHMEGLQYKQIAYRMNISVKAVEHHITVGLLKCRAFFRENGYEPAEFGAPVKKLHGPGRKKGADRRTDALRGDE